MVDIKVNCLMNYADRFKEIKALLAEKSPASEPYKFKYAAISALSSLKTDLAKLIDSSHDNNDNCERLSAMLAAACLRLGVATYETGDLSAGAEELKTVLTLTKEKALHPKFVVVRINALNDLGLVYSMLDQPQKSQEYLEEAEKIYKEFTEQDEPKEAYRVEHLFEVHESDITPAKSKAESVLEVSHTHTLYYLAQIYGTQKDHLRSAVYCHNTLKRQLESRDYDPIEWALNAATLSQFFMEHNGFKQARHHLAAASYVLDKYFEEHIKYLDCSSEEDEAKNEIFRHRSADVARCWAKYGLLLLEFSRDRLMQKADEDDDSGSPTTDLSQQAKSAKSDTSQDDISGLFFSTLEIPTYENQVTDKFILDYEDALPVFHCTKQWLMDAKRYYTLEEHASDYIRITQDASNLFLNLAFFESDEKRQCRMHKRRIDMLEDVLASVNHQCYLILCRDIWHELGEIYYEMLNIKLEKTKDDNCDTVPDPRVLNKINMLTQKSLDNFGFFLDSIYKEGSYVKSIKLEPDLIRPALMAHFFRGRLFTRFITCDTVAKVVNTKKAVASFKFIVDYCAEHPESEPFVKLELPLCKEMVELLPLKIKHLIVPPDVQNQIQQALQTEV